MYNIVPQSTNSTQSMIVQCTCNNINRSIVAVLYNCTAAVQLQQFHKLWKLVAYIEIIAYWSHRSRGSVKIIGLPTESPSPACDYRYH